MQRSRSLVAALAAIAACLLIAPAASAEPAAGAPPPAEKSWYADLGAGINWLDQESGHPQPADTGFRLSAVLGRALSPRWALELETGYLHNTLPAAKSKPEDTLTQVPVLVSLIHTFPTRTIVDPWLGLGAGIVIGSDNDDTGGDLALHFQVGVRHALDARKSVGLSYRFIMMGAGSALAAEPVGDDSLLLDFRFAL